MALTGGILFRWRESPVRHHHVELYECEVCGTRYPAAEEAMSCENTGRPSPRFGVGDSVVLCGGDYKDQFPGRVFRIRSRDVFLDRPGLKVWEEGTPGQHMITYVVEGDCDHCRMTFVPEHHLAPWKEGEFSA
jgi:hypothetical protein